MNDDGWIGTFNNTTTTNAVNEDLAIVPHFPSASNVSNVSNVPNVFSINANVPNLEYFSKLSFKEKGTYSQGR